jgi:hypothetical protein
MRQLGDGFAGFRQELHQKPASPTA